MIQNMYQINKSDDFNYEMKQAGAELCQAQVKLELAKLTLPSI